MNRPTIVQAAVAPSAGPCDLCGRRPAAVGEDPDTAGEYVTTGLCGPCQAGIWAAVVLLDRRRRTGGPAPIPAGQLELGADQ